MARPGPRLPGVRGSHPRRPPGDHPDRRVPARGRQRRRVGVVKPRRVRVKGGLEAQDLDQDGRWLPPPGTPTWPLPTSSPQIRSQGPTLEFSRTTDGGATWSSPVLIDQPSPFAIDFAPKILVLSDETLLAVFARADFAAGLAQLYAVRSPMRGGRGCRPCWLAPSRPPPRRRR